MKILDALKLAKENLGFLFICAVIVAAIIGIAYFSENLILKKKGLKRNSKRLKVSRMAIMAVLSAIAIVLMLFDVPLPFLPSFYKIDLSELPVLIGAFALGPVAGVIIEFLKVILNIFINSTTTAFVGEFANFLIGCAFVVPASIIYFAKKKKKNAIIGIAAGIFICIIAGCFLNAYVLLPKYAEVFHMPIEALIGKGTEKNAAINNLFTFCAFAVAPFNLIKCVIVSIITILVYKKISNILKADYYVTDALDNTKAVIK